MEDESEADFERAYAALYQLAELARLIREALTKKE